MKNSILVFLFCAIMHPAASAGERKEISAIREYYAETIKKAKDGSIYRRELSFEYPAVPGAGPASSKVGIFYELAGGQDGQYEYGIVRIENRYRHAAALFYEEYLFNRKGDLLFYFGRRGTSSSSRPDGAVWEQDERCYFWGGKLLAVMRGEEINDRPSAAEAARAAEIMQHAEELRTKSCLAVFPAPVMFPGE